MADQPSIGSIASSAAGQQVTSLSNYVQNSAAGLANTLGNGISEVSNATAGVTGANSSPSGEKPSLIPNLTPNTWVANNDASLAAADVYNNGNSTLITNIQSIRDKVTSFFDSNFGGGTSLLKKITSTLKDIRSVKDALLKGSIQSRIQALTGLSTKALANMGYAVPPDILDKVNKVTSVAVNVAGNVSKIKAGDLSSITNAAKLVGDFTGNPDILKVTDNVGKAVAAAGIARTAMQSGLAGSINAIAGQLVGNDAVKKFAAEILPDAVNTANITAITSIANTFGVGKLTKINPNAINSFCNAYLKPIESAKSDAKNNANDAYVCMNTMSDNWDTFSRTTDSGSVDTLNMAPVLNGSSDIKDSFQAYGVTGTNTWGLTDAFGLTGGLDVNAAKAIQYPKMVSVPALVTNKL